MKRICLLLMMSLTALNGCAESAALIKTGSNSIRSDVFQELSNGGIVPKGYADLQILSSLKTHKPGIYPFEKKSHGTPEYRLLVNIDGQAIQLQGNLQEENSEPCALRDPEAGDGIRYRYSKKLRLKAGTHKIIVALPDDEIAIEQEITLSDKGNNSLVVEPIYGAVASKQLPAYYGAASFTEGVRRLRLNLNGQDM